MLYAQALMLKLHQKSLIGPGAASKNGAEIFFEINFSFSFVTFHSKF